MDSYCHPTFVDPCRCWMARNHSYNQPVRKKKLSNKCAWLTVIVQSLLIIISRKHYTVKVVVAWYIILIFLKYVYICCAFNSFTERFNACFITGILSILWCTSSIISYQSYLIAVQLHCCFQ